MFKRLIYEDWQSIIPVAAFLLTFAGFLVLVIRAVFIKPDKAEHMASLPLSDSSDPHRNRIIEQGD